MSLLQVERHQSEPKTDARQFEASRRLYPQSSVFNSDEEAFTAKQFFSAIRGNSESRQWLQAHDISPRPITNVLGREEFILPQETARSVIGLREQFGVAERFARRFELTTSEAIIPRETGAATASWISEEGEITAADLTIGAATISARKLASLVIVSDELANDSVESTGYVVRSIAQSHAQKVDDAFFNGDGTSTHGGITGLKHALHANAIADAATGNDAMNNLDLVDWHDCAELLSTFPSAQPRWFMSSQCFYASCVRLAPEMVEIIDGQRYWMGSPVEFVPVMPTTTSTLASTIVAYYGDPRMSSTIGYLREFRVTTSPSRYLELDSWALRSVQRLGIVHSERGDAANNRAMVALKTAA